MTRSAGLRKRAYVPRHFSLSKGIQAVNEMVYEIYLEHGVCPNCRVRPLYVVKGRVYSKCAECIEYYQTYYNRRK